MANLVALAGIVVAALSFSAALWQYRQTQKWKRAEFTANEYKIFPANPEVKKAMLVLDWPSRAIELLSDQEKMSIDDVFLAEALGPKDLSPPYPPTHIAIRECFDQFLDGLAMFDYYLRTGLLNINEIKSYISYWLMILSNPKRRSSEARSAMIDYAKYYGYPIDSLIKTYDCLRCPSRTPPWRRFEQP